MDNPQNEPRDEQPSTRPNRVWSAIAMTCAVLLAVAAVAEINNVRQAAAQVAALAQDH